MWLESQLMPMLLLGLARDLIKILADAKQEIPRELAEDDGDAAYDPDPGPVTSGISPGMLRALSAVLAVLVVMLGLAALPGRLPAPVWAAGLAALVGALFLVFRALPRDSPRDDDGAVL